MTKCQLYSLKAVTKPAWTAVKQDLTLCIRSENTQFTIFCLYHMECRYKNFAPTPEQSALTTATPNIFAQTDGKSLNISWHCPS